MNNENAMVVPQAARRTQAHSKCSRVDPIRISQCGTEKITMVLVSTSQTRETAKWTTYRRNDRWKLRNDSGAVVVAAERAVARHLVIMRVFQNTVRSKLTDGI